MSEREPSQEFQPTFELGVLEEARHNLSSVYEATNNVPNQLREAEHSWRNAQRQLREAVLIKEELTDLDKAGWLIALSSADHTTDLGEAADKSISRLHELDTQLKHTDIPILAYEGPTFVTRGGFNFFTTSGEGILVELPNYGTPLLSIGISEWAKWSPSLDPVKADILMKAVSEPEAIEAMDVSRYVDSRGSIDPNDAQDTCMVIGKEAVTAFVDKLLRSTEHDYQRNRAEKAVYDIWTMAKHQGLRLDEQSEPVSGWLERWQTKSASQHAVRVVDALRNGYEIAPTVLDEVATELEVTPESIMEEAIRYNVASYKTVKERLTQLLSP